MAVIAAERPMPRRCGVFGSNSDSSLRYSQPTAALKGPAGSCQMSPPKLAW